jgi:hypothetical protein
MGENGGCQHLDDTLKGLRKGDRLLLEVSGGLAVRGVRASKLKVILC